MIAHVHVAARAVSQPSRSTWKTTRWRSAIAGRSPRRVQP